LVTYIQPASAGLGNYLDSDSYNLVRYDETDVPPRATFCIKISGDSMEPDYNDGDILFMESMPAIPNKALGVFGLNGEAIFKQLVVDHKNRRVKLHSINTKYNDIVVGEDDVLHTYGLVIGKIGEES